MYFYCLQIDGPITGGEWLLSWGRGAYKRKFTAVSLSDVVPEVSPKNLSDCQYCYYLFYSLYP